MKIFINKKNYKIMDSDYKLFDPKQEKEDEKKKKKNEHSSGYYKFVNQFKNHLKKIENDFEGEDITKLPNHFNLINKYENEFEEQRESCLNCYNALKEQISLIEKVVPNFDVNIFNSFFQNFEEYYSFFTKSQEILRTFSEFNDETQNLFYILKRKNFCVDALKEFADKISEEFADKVEQYDILKEKFKNLMESYDKLYKLYQETKSNDLNQYENIDNKELMIKKLTEKIQDLNIENDRIRQKYTECSNDLELLNLAVKVKYIQKSECEKILNEFKFKMKKLETDNSNFKQTINKLTIENEKLIQEKDSLEQQINAQLNNYHSYNNKGHINLDSLLDENEEKEEKEDKEENGEKEIENSEDIASFQGNDLGDLISDCEEHETEEEQVKENGQTDININKEPQKIEENLNSKISFASKPSKDTLITINENEDINKNLNINNINNTNNKGEDMKKTVSFNLKNDLKKPLLKKSNSKNIRLRATKKGIFKHSGSVRIREKVSTGNINSAYNVMFQGKQFQLTSSIAAKKNFDYFKQFFFLLFQSMKMNSEKIGPFLGFDPEVLYTQCRNEHIPFHKYQSWLEKQLFMREQMENEKKYEDFATITGIFCSSFI